MRAGRQARGVSPGESSLHANKRALPYCWGELRLGAGPIGEAQETEIRRPYGWGCRGVSPALRGPYPGVRGLRTRAGGMSGATGSAAATGHVSSTVWCKKRFLLSPLAVPEPLGDVWCLDPGLPGRVGPLCGAPCLVCAHLGAGCYTGLPRSWGVSPPPPPVRVFGVSPRWGAPLGPLGPCPYGADCALWGCAGSGW